MICYHYKQKDNHLFSPFCVCKPPFTFERKNSIFKPVVTRFFSVEHILVKQDRSKIGGIVSYLEMLASKNYLKKRWTVKALSIILAPIFNGPENLIFLAQSKSKVIGDNCILSPVNTTFKSSTPKKSEKGGLFLAMFWGAKYLSS